MNGTLHRILLVHWQPDELKQRANDLAKLGFEVDGFSSKASSRGMKAYRDRPPMAIVIDLSRLPSHGREVGLGFRGYKPTRLVPLIFVEGDPAKVDGIRRLMPDAVYTTWKEAPKAIKTALRRPPSEVVVPESRMAGYSGTPLPKKLGIKPDKTVALWGAPRDFLNTLGTLPTGVQCKPRLTGRPDLVLLFTKSLAELNRRLPPARDALAEGGGLWIAWPKKASKVPTDVTEKAVRAAGLEAGLVDYKICAIDQVWSGLLFARRGKPK